MFHRWYRLLVLVVSLVAAAPAHGLSWSVPQDIDGYAAITGIACPSVAMCIAVDDRGQILRSLDPASRASSWTRIPVHGHPDGGFTAIACPAVSLCIASGKYQGAAISTDAGTTWNVRGVSSDTLQGIAIGVACQTTADCATLMNQPVSSDTTMSNDFFVWTFAAPHPEHQLTKGELLELDADPTTDIGAFTSLACTRTICATVGQINQHNGGVWTTSRLDSSAPQWHMVTLPDVTLKSVSCPATSLCLAGGQGRIWSSTAPLTASSAEWTSAPADGTNAITALTCRSAQLCVAGDHAGGLLSSRAPADGHWTRVAADSRAAITAVRCPAVDLCVAADSRGRVLIGR